MSERRPSKQVDVIKPDPYAAASVADPLWLNLRDEAEEAMRAEPFLAPLVTTNVLARASLEEAIAHRVAARLGSDIVSREYLGDVWAEAVSADGKLAAGMRADMRAVLERDPAVRRALEPALFFKGYHALQTHRLAHWLWHQARRDLALFLQSRSSEVFQVDIHPAVRIGAGIFLDHATGFTAGETASIGDDVSILQGVALSGTGTGRGQRHPAIRSGCLLGAGAQIIGAIEIGAGARVASGSVVLDDVPPCTTVAGVPAKIVGSSGCSEPAKLMDQRLTDAAYASFNYSI